MTPFSASPEQLHALLELVERDGYRRILIESRDVFDETLTALVGGRRYRVSVGGEVREVVR